MGSVNNRSDGEAADRAHTLLGQRDVQHVFEMSGFFFLAGRFDYAIFIGAFFWNGGEAMSFGRASLEFESRLPFKCRFD